MKCLRGLFSGAHNVVPSLTQPETAELYLEATRPEVERVKFADNVNGLVYRFLRLDFDAALKAEMLTIERLYSTDCRSDEVEKRALWLDVFQNE